LPDGGGHGDRRAPAASVPDAHQGSAGSASVRHSQVPYFDLRPPGINRDQRKRYPHRTGRFCALQGWRPVLL